MMKDMLRNAKVGERGTFWAVEKGMNHRAAAFYRHEMPDAEKVALAVRDKLNYFWQLLGKEES